MKIPTCELCGATPPDGALDFGTMFHITEDKDCFFLGMAFNEKGWKETQAAIRRAKHKAWEAGRESERARSPTCPQETNPFEPIDL